ncbi:MAG: acetylglutamate kinase [Microthrixaceae bacterium]
MSPRAAGEGPLDGSSPRSPESVVDVLLQALPYIEAFRGSVVVVKFGGNAMVDPELFESFASDIVWMHRVGMRPVVVHGGGPQIGQWMERLGRESTFVDGRRVTDAETLEVAQMVLIGKVNSDIVTALNSTGPVAVGLSGTDASMLQARPHDPELGFVGAVREVHPELIERTLAMDLVPVLATIGVDVTGQRYNINADDAATAVAQAPGRREAGLPDRCRGPARGRGRSGVAHQLGHPGAHRRAHRRRHDRRGCCRR